MVLLVVACLLGVGNSVLGAVNLLKVRESRQDTIRRSCQDTNVRHDSTLAEYDRGLLVRLTGEPVDSSVSAVTVRLRLHRTIDALPKGRREQVRESRAFLRLLIDKLSPKRDCTKRAERLTK